ncbi:MAG: lysophospholipid acyltransferase family protein [Cycloclasticus pugetii]|jgi:KDO2-lipid IV(A) lauroyltransferase|uniref:Lipid A biosynthesis lauroyl acyltransferase subfamily protein n=2 Tax=Cycloclasticus TaxID=34067 RepID=A0AB33Z3X2_9GAMM|nr:MULTISPECIES: lysophospholipid acyltransferase family protein [Cycloclasticus]AFT66965.1 Lipid A biosynthesis lauroyl acyltransferase subfamily [Cycloclasticus sp. P1]ATI03433.1 lipid A biosynthesis protein [Cycloclasticus sp. PY97N]EPD13908.1 Lipid A biosynthesis lauroyl acyltransferase subfamily protein [Cycloclasticus pugetii]
MATQKFKLSYLHPKYWPAWLAVGVSRCMAILPRSWQFSLSKWIANRLASKENRRISTIRRNIDRCFANETDAYREELVRANIKSSALMLFDLFNIIWRPPADMTANIKVVGEEYLEQALRADRPLLLVIGHFTPLFHAISKLSTLAPFDVIYRRMNNPVMEANLYQRGAGKYPITLFHRKDIRKMLEKLADNGTVFIAPDQDFGVSRGAFVSFFGIPTATITTIPQYAQQTNAQVMLLSAYRDGEKGSVIEFEPVLENYPTGDDVADTQRWTDWLEEKIRLHPADYLWMHKRFKTRPKGEPGFYK